MIITSSISLLLLIAINAVSGLKCYYCENNDCSEMSKVKCDKSAVVRTYAAFYGAFMWSYKEPVITNKYECLTMNTTFVDGEDRKSEFLYKGCVVEFYLDPCGIYSNQMYHKSEIREHCRVCNKDLCNGSSSIEASFTLFTIVVLIIKVTDF